MIQVFVPGKIHLIGEHFVVFGKPAILAPINLGINAEISGSAVKEILGIVQYDNAIKNLQSSIEKEIKTRFKIKQLPKYRIELDIKIPVGSGLGSSASLSAVFTIGLLKFLKIDHTDQDVFEIALEGEKIFHGNPSGGDLAAVLSKNLILFRKDAEDLKTITPLQFKIHNNFKKFILIDSGKPVESTSDMVSLVSLRSADRRSGNLDKIFDSQEILAGEMMKVLKVGDEDKFKEILTRAEVNLEKLGVVGNNAKAIITEIKKIGGCAKITGAGGIKKGSGMILAFHKDLNKLIQFAKNNNLSYYPISI